MEEKKTIRNIVIGIFFIIIIYSFYTTFSIDKEPPKVDSTTNQNIYLQTDYKCLSIGTKDLIAIATKKEGKLRLTQTDKERIQESYIEENFIHIRAGLKPGRTEINIKEITNNINKKITIDVYSLNIPEIGKQLYVGDEIWTNIIAEGTGNLTCTSQDETVATCRIEKNKLYINALKKGTVNIKVNNLIEYNGQNQECGTANFIVVILDN